MVNLLVYLVYYIIYEYIGIVVYNTIVVVFLNNFYFKIYLIR